MFQHDKILNWINNKGLQNQTFVYLDPNQQAKLQIEVSYTEKSLCFDLHLQIKKILSFKANAKHVYNLKDEGFLFYSKYSVLNKAYEKNIEVNKNTHIDPIFLLFKDLSQFGEQEISLTDIISMREFKILETHIPEQNLLQITVRKDSEHLMKVSFYREEAIASSFEILLSGFADLKFSLETSKT